MKLIRPQEYKDFSNVSLGREFLNKSLLPRYAFSCPDGSDILFVGVHRYWDYASLWNNPAKLCNFYTLDNNPGTGVLGDENYYPTPDYNYSIENCDELESNRFQQIIMIGVYEYLDHFDDKCVPQIYRILKSGGHVLFGFTGKGEYDDARGMGESEVYDRLKPLRVIENYSIFNPGSEKCNSVCTVAIKI